MLYREQISGIDIRLRKKENEVYQYIFSVLFLGIIDVLMFVWFTKGTFSWTWISWLIVFVIFVAIAIISLKMVDSIIEYNIHREKRGYIRFKKRYNIFTLMDEKRFCARELKKLEDIEAVVATTENIEDIKKRKGMYYIEKRADSQKYCQTQKNGSIFIAIIIVVCVAVYADIVRNNV